MKSIKKAGFLALAVSALALVACGGTTESKESNPSTPTSSSQAGSQTATSSTAPVDAKKIKVKINGVESEVAQGSKLEKPADPEAPAGKVFYGWKNVKNGGQIWNFEADIISEVWKEVELEPLFIDAGLKKTILEAELCPDIVHFDYDEENDDWIPMSGETYSGGQQGKGLIGREYEGDNLLTTTIESFSYYDTEFGAMEKFDEGLPEDKDEKQWNKDVVGAFVHFNYHKGNTLTWEIESDVAADNVVIFARYSAEYGLQYAEHGSDEEKDRDGIFTKFNDKGYKVLVNGVACEYGSIQIDNIVDKFWLPYQDYLVTTTVSLKAGKNTIQMLVDNDDSLNGTISSTAPCIDSIVVYSTSTISWPEARGTNMIRD